MNRRRFFVVVILALAVIVLGAISCRKQEPPVVYEPLTVRERIAIDAREDSYVYNGADIRFYTDDHSTETHRIDAGAGVVFAAPTAIATATPGTIIDSDGVSKILSVQDGGTEVLAVNDGGQMAMAVPTALATSVPAVAIDSSAVGNTFEIRAAATPVLAVNQDGTVVGQVLQYTTAGTQIVCGSQTVTDTAAAVHGLTTPLFALASLGQAPTGDAVSAEASISGVTVTLAVINTALTPAANSTGAVVEWCVIGTP